MINSTKYIWKTPSPNYNADLSHFKGPGTEILHGSNIVAGVGGNFYDFIKYFAHDCLKKSNFGNLV